MNLWRVSSFIFIGWAFFSQVAQAGPASFSYQGQIIKPDGLALEAPNVQFTIEVRSPAPNSCLLYRERHTRNMSASNGIYSLQVGDGTRLGTTDPADTATLTDALNKSAGLLSGLTCASGNSYTPNANDDYELRVIFNDGSGPNVVAQNHVLRSVPYAMSAQSLNGLQATDLLSVRDEPGFELNQANLESVFTDTNYPELMALLNGTSTQYLSALPGAPFSMNSQRITDLANPTAATDAANKNYVDSYIGGSVANGAVLSTLGAGQAGQVLTWDGNEWTVSTPSMIDATKLPLAGGTMAGAIDMAGNNLVNAGAISSGSVTTTGAVTVGDSLSVTNGASVGQNLTVTGNASVGGNSTLTGDLSVSGQTSLDQDLLVAGGIGVTNGISSDNYIILNDENELRFGDSGSNYVGFKGPAAAAGAIIWELPGSDGLAGQVLATDGFGQLSWIDPSLAAPVSSVYGRTGAVVAQAGDYSAAQVSNAPAGNIGATTVQAAINELDTEKASVTALSALDTRVGTAETNITGLTTDLAATDAAVAGLDTRLDTAETDIDGLESSVTGLTNDLATTNTAVAGLDTRLDTAETDIDNLEAGLATTNTNLTNLDNAKVNRAGDTMTGALNLDNQQELRLSELDGNGANFVALRSPANLAGNTVWTLPLADGGAGEVLSTDGAGNLSFIAIPSAPVSSVYGRTGAVVAQAGDYNAGQVTSTPVGDLSATDVQAALAELDSEKASVASLAATDTAVAALDTRLDSAETNISTLTTDLAATDTAVTALDGRVSANETAITALGGRMTSAEAELVAQDGRLDTAETDIDGLDTRLTLAEGSLSTLGTDYTALEGRVDTAENDINTLETNLATTNTNLSNLDSAKVNRGGDSMTGALQMNAQTELRLADSDSSNYVGLRAPAAIGANYVFTLPTTDGDAGQVLETDGNGVLTWKSLDAVGETNVGENLGAGAPVYSGKVGTNLQFRSLAAVNNKVSVAQNGNLVEIGVNEGNFDSDAIPNTPAGSIAAATVQDAINELDSEKASITALASTDAAVAGLDTRLDTAETNIGTLTTDLSTLAGRVTVNEGAITTLDTRLDTAKTDIDGLDTRLILAEGSLANLGTDYTALEGRVDTAETDINALETSVNGLTTDLATTNTNVTNLDNAKVNRAGDSMTGALQMNAQTELRLADSDSSNYVGLRAPAAIGANYVFTLPTTDGDAGQVLETDGNGVLTWKSLASVGETNVGENLGAGAQVYAGKVGANLQFRSLAAVNNKVSVAQNGNLVEIGVNEANFNSGAIPNTPAGTLAATTVQGAINELDADKVAKAGDVMSGSLTLANQNELRLGDGDTNYVGFVAPASVGTNMIWELPAVDGLGGQVLATDGLGSLYWVNPTAAAPVDSVFGRTGDVVAQSGDYSASLITNTPAGNIAATEVQAALNELDSEKVGSTRQVIAGDGLAGGGDLSADRTFNVGQGQGILVDANSVSVDITGQVAMVGTAQGTDELLVFDISENELRKVTRANFVLSEAEVDSFVSNNGFATATDLTTLTGRVTTAEGAITALDGRVTTAETDITNLENNVTALGTDKVAKAGDAMTGPLTLNATNEMRFADADSSNYVGFAAPALVTANIVWTLPEADGSAGQVLQTDGAGVLSWANSGTPNRIADADGDTSVETEQSPDEDVLRFRIGGGQVARIAGSGGATNRNNMDLTMYNWSSGGNNMMHFRNDGGTYYGAVGYRGSTNSISLEAGGLNSVTFQTSGEERARITSAGDMVIGSTTALERLTVQGSLFSGPKGTGAGQAGALLMGELAANGTNFVGLRAPDVIGTNLIWTLPSSDGTPGQVLSTDGSGALSWATPSGGSPTFPLFADPVGTAAAPAYSFTGTDSDNGMFRPAADSVGLSTAGTERLRIDATGNVGIGETSPTSLLHIKSGSTDSVPNLLTLHNPFTGSWSGSALQFLGSTNTRLGAIEVHYDGGTCCANMIFSTRTSNNTTSNPLKLRHDGWLYVGGDIGYIPAGMLNVAYQTSTGNSVANSFSLLHYDDNSGGANGIGNRLKFAVETTTNGTYATSAAIDSVMEDANNNSKDGSLRFLTMGPNAASGVTDPTEKMRITSAGFVGIGTTTPAGILDVQGGTAPASTAGAPINIVGQSSGAGAGNLGGNVNITTGLGAGGWSDGSFNVSLGNGGAYIYRNGGAYSSSGAWYEPGVPNLEALNTSAGNGNFASFGLSARNTGNTQQRAYFGVSSNSSGHSPEVVIGQQTGANAYQERVRITASGSVGIGTTTPRARLDVNGAIAAAPAVAEAGDIVDFGNSNFAYTAGNCRTLALHNMKDGATYTLAIQGTGVGTCAFNAFSGAGSGALTVRLPPDHGPTENTKETLYSFVVIGTRVYVAWIPGY